MHGHEADHGSELSDVQLRVRALEQVLTEKGYLDPAALDQIVEAYETRIGPHIGAGIVAKAWADPPFGRALLADATRAIRDLGHDLTRTGHLTAVANDGSVHNLVVCTLCSCYPNDILGLPPVWYKSAPYRSRAVKEPRRVLRELGVDLPLEVGVRVWDSTSEMRYLVVPRRPAGTDGWSEDRLAGLVTRDSMIGAGLALQPADVA
ncbi:MAG: nitrile hydratase subunit alpha [Acidimicrobiales bacterium]